MALYDTLATVTTGTSPYGITITPNGSKVYVANDSDATISVINTSSNTVTSTITLSQASGPPYPRCIGAHPNGSWVYAVGYNNAKLHSINTSTDAVTVSSWLNTSIGIAVGQSGTIYTSHDPQNVVTNGTNSCAVGATPFGVAVNPAETRIYCCNWYHNNVGSLSVVNTQYWTTAATITTGLSYPRYAVVSPDGSKVYVTNSGNGKVSVVDASNNTITANITVGTGPFGIVMNATGTKVYVANSGGTTISVIDTALASVVGTISVNAAPKYLTINALGTRLYSLNANSTVSVIDISEAKSGFFSMF